MTAERPTTAAGGRRPRPSDRADRPVPRPVRAPTESDGLRAAGQVFFGLFAGGMVTLGVMNPAGILTGLKITVHGGDPRIFLWLGPFAAASLNLSIARSLRHAEERGWRAGILWAAVLDVLLGIAVLVGDL